MSIVLLRFSGGYVLPLGSMLLGTSGDLVKSCETDPMGQSSLLAVLAYGRLTFRLRPGYIIFSDFSNPFDSIRKYHKIQ